MDENTQDFNEKVIAAVESKVNWYNTSQLPKVQDDYRMHLVCVNNIIDTLVRRSLIVPDPYKKDKKISSVVPPEDTPFNDNERASKLGIRLSDYQSMLEFICNYMKFAVEHLNTEKIRKLLEFNATFNWANLSINSAKVNTRALAIALAEARNNTQGLQVAMLNDNLAKGRQALDEINTILKPLSDFQKERYKGDVRKNVICNEQFDKSKMQSEGTFVAEIKRLFSTCMPKRPFAVELINEIVAEELSPEKDELQKKVLAKLQFEEKKKVVKDASVDTHEMLMDAVRVIGGTAEQYANVLNKFQGNHSILQMENNTLGTKIKRVFRKAFGIDEPPVFYTITLVDKTTNARRHEKVNFSDFSANLAKRVKYYQGLAVKNSPVYAKLNAQAEKTILEFVEKQLVDCGRLHVALGALDDFFKNAVHGADRAKVKGIKMELSTIKNLMIKTNQIKSEYCAYIEEQEQMKKLGLKNE